MRATGGCPNMSRPTSGASQPVNSETLLAIMTHQPTDPSTLDSSSITRNVLERWGFRTADSARKVKLEQPGIADRPRQSARQVTKLLQLVAHRAHLGQQVNCRCQGIS